MKNIDINWEEIAGEHSSRVRPETSLKYFPKNPLRQALIKNFLERVAQMLSGVSWQSLLDVGCGEGFVDYYLDRRFPGKLIKGADSDRDVLEVARAINPALDFIATDGKSLPFGDNSFDAVICIEMLEHVEDYGKVIDELMRVSRGPCLVSVPGWPWYQATNFLIGKNWARLGEHPDHVAQFSSAKFKKVMESAFGAPVTTAFSFPWRIGLGGVKEK